MKNFNTLTRFLLTCAGVDLNTMRLCPSSEVNKYKITGSAVLLPASLGLFSGWYAMYLISQNFLISSLFAPCWGVVIFILDRAVVSSTTQGKLSGGVVGRIFLSVIIAFTISEPLILNLFNDSIQERRASIIDNKEKEATANLHEQIAEIKQQEEIEKAKVEALQKSYIEEADGTGGSRVPNKGPIAEIKGEAYENALAVYNQSNELRDAQISTILEEITAKKEEVEKNNANGLLGKMIILGALSNENNTVWWSLWLVRLLFLCIELIPILIKLSGSTKVGVYEEIVDVTNKICIDVQKLSSEKEKEVIRLERSVLLNKRMQELVSEEIMHTTELRLKDNINLLEKIQYMMEQQLKLKAHITEKVKDDVYREELLDQVSMVYESFVTMLNTLIAKLRLSVES